MMKCPKCDYERQPRDSQYVPATECPACGIVYAKSGPASKSDGNPPTVSLIKKPSPVDEVSLKKARERVEMRLRKQLESRVHDERHAQTLERARMITALEAEKRKTEKSTRVEAAPSAEDESEPILDLVDVAEDHHQIKTMPAAPAADQVDQSESDESTLTDSSMKAEDTDSLQPEPETTPADADLSESETDLGESFFVSAKETPSTEDNITHMDPSSRRAENTTMEDDDGSDEDHAPAAADETTHQMPMYPRQQPVVGGGDFFGRLLPAVAWLILIAGIVGAVLSWTTLKDVQAGVRLTTAPGLSSLPLGLLLGFAYLATGVLGFAFFWVSSLISRQLKDIRRLLLTYSAPMSLKGDEEMD